MEIVRAVPDAEQIADRFFSARERALLRALPEKHRTLAFLNCWTRKEAYLKALGNGLERPLDRFAVSLAPGEPARLIHVDGDTGETKRWSLRALAIWPHAVAALAAEGQGWQLTCRHWAEGPFAVATGCDCGPEIPNRESNA